MSARPRFCTFVTLVTRVRNKCGVKHDRLTNQPTNQMSKRMFTFKSKWIALLAGLSLVTSPVFAGESGALLDVLIRKGVISDQEAEDIRADLSRESQEFVIASVSGGKATNSIALSGRMQLQYAGLSTDQNVAATSQFFLRRIYFGVKAGVGADWTANLNYDFSGGNFDKAYMEWSGYAGGTPIALDFGLRKVNLGYEETTSSGSLKSIERSPVTRYFVEPNNGRRLGAASYRIGAYLDGGDVNARKGKTSGFFFGAAATNPQRTESTGDGSVDGSKSSGSSATNTVALWADAGYTGMFSGGKLKVGAAMGILPDQGGVKNTALGKGYDMNVFSLYGDLTMGKFNLAGEYLSASVDDGAGVGKDASPSGYWIQPSFNLTEKVELVARLSSIDADGRGVKISDGVRSSPAANTGQKLEELFLGMTYTFVENGMKFQIGYTDSKLSDGSSENGSGVRSQMQIDF